MKRVDCRLGITIGDPAGIGPEVALRAVNDLRDDSIVPVVIGRYDVLERHYGDLIAGYSHIEAGFTAKGISPGSRYIFDMPLQFPLPLPGAGSRDTGAESLAYIDAAIDLWKNGLVDGIVTAPVSKGYIEKSGCRFTGHTEYIADVLHETYPYMMMYSQYYRVLLVTTHLPLERVAATIDGDMILRTIYEGHRAIAAIDGGSVRMAITGLDPHCGDDGAIGKFDAEVTAPAVRAARENGIDIEGPFAADTIFLPERWKRYNLVISHYHDQGLIPFKMMAFDSGVNVTLGLSIVRTSADHGTAYDIAGKRCAMHTSMREAIVLASRLVAARRPQK